MLYSRGFSATYTGELCHRNNVNVRFIYL